jgi:hypothetical protein
MDTIRISPGQRIVIEVVCTDDHQEAGRSFDIAHYSQNDPRWKDIVYDGGYTFGASGCLVCSVAMIASIAYPEVHQDPTVVAELLRNSGALDGNGLLSRAARIHDALPRLEWGGVIHWRNREADLDVVRREIAKYGATIIELKWNPNNPVSPANGNQHFAVAIWNYEFDVKIIDPWDGTEKWLNESRYSAHSGWSALQAIHGLRMVRPVIE